MATLPAFFRKSSFPAPAPEPKPTAARPAPDPYRVRPLPHDDVVFYCKAVDNTRLVREADPKARGACWTAIGAACLVLAAMGAVFAPAVTATIRGYRIEELRKERARLIDERRFLELEEARLLNPSRLEELARQRHLAAPAPGQVIHLDGKAGDALALAKQ